MKKPIVLVITGPTAVGKSELVRHLAERYPIEVLNADSRQVYRYMPIGTAQPSAKERQEIKYHLIDFLEPDQTFSAGSFLSYCKKEIVKVISQNKIPVIVGGSFFYIRSLWDGLLQEPEIPQELKKEVETLERETILSKLKKLDPISHQKIHPNNIRRLQRALLISMAAQKPFSAFPRKGGIYDQYTMLALCLEIGKEKLAERIGTRIRKMLKSGWIGEVEKLLAMGFDEKSPALKTLGYPEIIQFIKQRRSNQSNNNPKAFRDKALRDMIQVIHQKTRHFAKRQRTWFRNEKRLKKIDHIEGIRYIGEVLMKYPYLEL